MKKVISLLISAMMICSFLGMPFNNNGYLSKKILISHAAEGRLYNQWEQRWKDIRYDNYSNISGYEANYNSLYDAGCGIFSFANALYALNDSIVDIKEVSDWAVNAGALRPGVDGLWRETFYSQVESVFGAKYGFTVVGYDCGGAYDERLRNHLANGGVAIGNVYDHFIALTGYDGTNGYYHVIESAVYYTRGLEADSWVSSQKLSDGNTNIKWFALLNGNGNNNFKPSKPSLRVNTDSSGTVTFNWNACSGTTHYDLRVYNSNDEIVYAIGHNEDAVKFNNVVTYTDTSLSTHLDKGSYYARVAAVNGDSYQYTFSEFVSFNVEYDDTPSKPSLRVNTDSSGTATFNWNACSSTTHYDLRIYNSNDEIVYAIGQNEDAIKFDNWTTYTDTSLSTHLDKGSYYARVAAVNNDAAKYTFSDYVTFAVSNPPTISNLEVKYDTSGYTIKCKVSDQGSGINRVQFPTWTVKNDQDDIQSSWWDNPQARGEINGNEVTYRVNISEHNNELGEYVTHIYAYDDSGNYECYAVPHITIENQKPIISNVKIKDIDTTGYTVQCKVIDEGGSGINRVQFPTWTLADGQDDLFSNWETDSNSSGILDDDYVTYRVNISDHNNELTDYKTHIYAYDNCGNYVCYGELPSIDIPTLTTTTSMTTTQKPTTTTTTSMTTTQKPTTTTTTSMTTTQKPTTTTTTSTTTTQKPTTTTMTSTTTTQKPTTTTTTSTTTTQKPTTTTNLEKTEISLKNGEQYSIPISLDNITFKSTNTNVAVVSPKGIITAIGLGNAIINIIDKDYNVIQLKITVKADDIVDDNYILGDVNNDGQINAVDASSVLSYYAMISTNKDGGFDDAQKSAADVNNDGQINAVDASCILSYYAYVSTSKEEILTLESYLKKK